jgi:uncharacterized tellurite resistance protein B-like protein
MFDALKAIFTRPAVATPEPAGGPDRRLQIAACALLLEMAHADRDFTEAERLHIEEIAMRQFDLASDEARDLLAVAEEARSGSVDLHQFTALVSQHYDEGQRMVLAELLWRIVYADGALAEAEAQLARKVGRLLDLRPGYLSEAKRRATGR